MNQLKIENFNAVALLNRLRQATHTQSKTSRKGLFNDLRNAIRSLGLVTSGEKIEALYEGVDLNGDHWFMAQFQARGEPGSDDQLTQLNSEIERLSAIATRQRSVIADIRALSELFEDKEKFPFPVKFLQGFITGATSELNLSQSEIDTAKKEILKLT